MPRPPGTYPGAGAYDFNPRGGTAGMGFDPRIGYYDPTDEAWRVQQANDIDAADAAGNDVGLIASETAKKVRRELPGVTFKPGTVVSVDDTNTSQYITAHVNIDGDDPSNTTQTVSEIGSVTVGARVRVKFEPPQGVYLSGVLMGECDDFEQTWSHHGEVTTAESVPWPATASGVAQQVIVMALTPGLTDTTITIFVDGIDHMSFTFAAGETVLFLDQTQGADFQVLQDQAVTVQASPVGTDLADLSVTIRFCEGGGRVEEECQCINGCCDDAGDCPPGFPDCVDGCCEGVG